MIRALILLAGVVAGVIAFAASGAQAAGTAQTLGILLHHNVAATERLPHYLASAPISVKVGGGYARRLPALAVVAHGPDGETIHAPLARNGDEFTGTLLLVAPGNWTVSADSANVMLDVVAGDGEDLAARIAYALSALSIVAGLALVVRVNGRPLALASAKKRS